MELTLDAAGYRPGQPVTLQLDGPAPAGAGVIVYHLDRVVREIVVPEGSRSVGLGVFERGGYGVAVGEARTAFDVLESPFERPRYGFVAALADGVDVEAVATNFRRLHLTIAQFYDWAYRHSTLMPPTERYLDPLSQERTLATVNSMASALVASGTVPLGYSAVYAVGHDEIAQWESSLIHRPDGEPYRLGDNFLVLVDPADERWLEHYLGELESVLAGTRLQGFHLDQYGWPKFAQRADGATVDLTASFVTLLDAIRKRMPSARMMFNNVNDFPTYATAPGPQDATYIEVWPPHSTLQDLALLATSARRHRSEHPPILSAYLSCFADDEDRAMTAAMLVMATAFSHGATHLLLGEHDRVLTGPYYPDNHALTEQNLARFEPWYAFAVRYGDWLYDSRQTDVTEFFAGGINGDVVIEGAPVSTRAEAGTIWTRVVRTGNELLVHLVNLTNQTETEWDAGKEPLSPVTGLTLKLSMVGAGTPVQFVSVERPDLVTIASGGVSTSDQTDALTAAQASAEYTLPPLLSWAIIRVHVG